MTYQHTRGIVDFAIVIPTHNRSVLLRDALASIASQTVAPKEVIVVDDGSSEDIRQVLDQAGFPTLYLRTESVGPGPARNAGVQAATATYVSFLDSDDLWAPGTLELLAHQVNTAPPNRSPLVYLNALMFSCATDEVQFPAGELKVRSWPTLLAGDQTISVATSRFGAVARELFLELKGFWPDRANSEDTDFALRAGASAPFHYIESPICVAQRYHAGQVSTALDRFARGIKMLVAREKQGVYPGGQAQFRNRIRWICYHVRSCCWHMASGGRYGDGLDLYLRCFSWHLRLRRWSFLVVYPLFWLYCSCTRSRRRYEGTVVRTLKSVVAGSSRQSLATTS